MKSLKFKKIDAFAENGSSGNPAGYIWLDKPSMLGEAGMQQIAGELKGFVNEVGFVFEENGQYHLRYFSSECEVAFCGHATIAIMYDLLRQKTGVSSPSNLTIRVKAGDLTVYNSITDENAVYITAPEPKYLDCRMSTGEIVEALSISLDDINRSRAIRVIDAGLRTLIVPINDLDGILRIKPDQENLRLFCVSQDFDILLVYTDQTALSTNRFRTRVFAPKFGYLEDPATGSGNSAFGYYLLNENLWPGDFTIEQGPSRTNPNIVKIKCKETNGETRILFGGCATTRIDGQYILQTG